MRSIVWGSRGRGERAFGKGETSHRIPPRDPKGDTFRAARFDYGLRPSLKMTAEGGVRTQALILHTLVENSALFTQIFKKIKKTMQKCVAK
jgi:hypothetical protein